MLMARGAADDMFASPVVASVEETSVPVVPAAEETVPVVEMAPVDTTRVPVVLVPVVIGLASGGSSHSRNPAPTVDGLERRVPFSAANTGGETSGAV